MLPTRQGYDARRLFEGDDQDRENNQSDCVSNRKKGVQSATTNEKEKKQPPMNSDVAAFASRAHQPEIQTLSGWSLQPIAAQALQASCPPQWRVLDGLYRRVTEPGPGQC
ncbi:hypothetical protein J4Q44_G00079590 [Coregonus suidteri]|uniref:Uncharacterized protein n=1 Tax=Coregonus suidteri TaxID=861788 RepID=A0AAN8LY51_9TELE